MLVGSVPSISVAPSAIELLLLAVGAEAVLGEVDDLRARVGVLELDHVDVFGSDARRLVRGTRRVDRRRPAVSSIGSHGLCTSNAPSRRVRTVVAFR